MNDREVIETLKHEAAFREAEAARRVPVVIAKVVCAGVVLVISAMSICSMVNTRTEHECVRMK